MELSQWEIPSLFPEKLVKICKMEKINNEDIKKTLHPFQQVILDNKKDKNAVKEEDGIKVKNKTCDRVF